MLISYLLICVIFSHSLSPSFPLSLSSGSVDIYSVDDGTGVWTFSHSLKFTKHQFPEANLFLGPVQCLEWSYADASVIAVSWKSGGLSLWSVFGSLLLCSLGDQPGYVYNYLLHRHWPTCTCACACTRTCMYMYMYMLMYSLYMYLYIYSFIYCMYVHLLCVLYTRALQYVNVQQYLPSVSMLSVCMLISHCSTPSPFNPHCTILESLVS